MVTGAFSKICLDGAVGVEKRQKKIRDVTLLTKIHVVKVMFFFPVVMYAWEGWTIKKAEHQRTDTFELWCWRRP